MNNDPHKKSIYENIQAAIKKGDVTMRPRWHFIIRSSLLGVGFVLLLLTLIYVASFIIFTLHQTGVWFAPIFGLNVFLVSLPWMLILVALLFIILLEILVKKYSFGYRRPLLYSALGVIILVVVGGLVVAATPLHSNFLRQAREGHLPVAGEFYKHFGMRPPPNIHPGMITELTDTGCIMKTPEDDVITVVITSDTKFPSGSDFDVNDKILVLGQQKDLTIIAEGMSKLEDMSTSTDHARRQIRFEIMPETKP